MLRPLFLTIIILTAICGLLAGCATNKSGSEEKAGMYFDAVLEFVVEYPLAWQKDRRLPYNSTSGEVRWTHPQYQGVQLKIKSTVITTQQNDKDQAQQRLSSEYPEFELYKKEQRTLLETEATYAEGQARGVEFQSYMIDLNNRNYLISLEQPIDNEEDFQPVMDRVVKSFQIISEQ